MNVDHTAERLANLTFSLLANCQEKEIRLAEIHDLTQAEFRCLRLFGTDGIQFIIYGKRKNCAERSSIGEETVGEKDHLYREP